MRAGTVQADLCSIMKDARISFSILLFALSGCTAVDVRPAPASEQEVRSHALAFGAIVNLLNHEEPCHLEYTGKDMTQESERQLLADWWDVHNKEDLLKELQQLIDKGHRDAFNRTHDVLREISAPFVLPVLELGIPATTTNGTPLLEKAKDRDEFERRLVVLYFLSKNPVFVNYKPTPYLTAWDLGRYINVCEFGFRAGYLTEPEAWDLILPVARRIQLSFNSWEEFAQDYIMGRTYWWASRMRQDGSECNQVVDTLLSKNGAWDLISWNASLGDGPIASDPQWNKMNVRN